MADVRYAIGDVLTNGESVYPRDFVTGNTIAMTSQLLRLTYFTAQKSFTSTQTRMETGAVAAGATPTLIRVGLWTADDAGALVALVASTANDTTLLAGIGTSYAKAWSSSYAVVAGQRYATGLLVVTGATAPQMCGQSGVLVSASYGTSPRSRGVVGGQADLPASVASGSITNSTARVYFEVLPA